MPKRSTNFNSPRFRPTAADLVNLMDWASVPAGRQREIAEEMQAATPTLYRLSYKHRHADPWQETEPMLLREIPLARARLRSQYAIVIKEWQDADGNWNS